MVGLRVDFYYYFLAADAVVPQKIQTRSYSFLERTLVQQQHFTWLHQVQVKEPR